MDITKWHETYTNVFEFAEWLEDEHYWVNTSHLLRYFEKPWKWTPEYELWRQGKTLEEIEDLVR